MSFNGMNLVDRLRKRAELARNACQFGDETDMLDAAAEIEFLRKRNDQLLHQVQTINPLAR